MSVMSSLYDCDLQKDPGVWRSRCGVAEKRAEPALDLRLVFGIEEKMKEGGRLVRGVC